MVLDAVALPLFRKNILQVAAPQGRVLAVPPTFHFREIENAFKPAAKP